MSDKRKAYEEKLDTQLKEWDAEIALLKAKADNAKSDEKIDYYETIETLEHKQDKAKTKFQELKAGGGDRTEQHKGASLSFRGVCFNTIPEGKGNDRHRNVELLRALAK